MADQGFETNMDLSRATGIDNTVISRWRNGETVPQLDQLRKLEKALDTKLLELMVRAGHLTQQEADLKVISPTTPVARPIDPTRVLPDDLTADQIAEIRRFAEYVRSQNPAAR